MREKTKTWECKDARGRYFENSEWGHVLLGLGEWLAKNPSAEPLFARFDDEEDYKGLYLTYSLTDDGPQELPGPAVNGTGEKVRIDAVYRGYERDTHDLRVTRDSEPLHSEAAQKAFLYIKGFDWGRINNHAHLLSLTMLLDHGLPEETASKLFPKFTDEVVSNFPDESWEYSGEQISEWLSRQEGIERF